MEKGLEGNVHDLFSPEKSGPRGGFRWLTAPSPGKHRSRY